MTLPYELALELKNAGWPWMQSYDCGHPGEWIGPDGEPRPRHRIEGAAYSPSLDELIEACPSSLADGMWSGNFVLEKWDDGYTASYAGHPKFNFTREDAKEAIAHLWLALKKEGKI